MNGEGHLNFAIYSVSLLGAGVGVHKLGIDVVSFEFVVGVYIGMRLPDMDHKNTKLGKVSRIPWLHKKLSKYKWYKGIFKHGGITHTILVNAWIFIIAIYFKSLLGAGIGLGYLTHLYADDITGNKLPMLYWPFKIKRRK